jgi:hypothetical protein
VIVGRLGYDELMDLPPDFTVDQRVAVTSVQCDWCGAVETERGRPHVVLLEWAGEHRCAVPRSRSSSPRSVPGGGP